MRLLTEPSLWSAGASVGLSSALQMGFTVCLCFLMRRVSFCQCYELEFLCGIFYCGLPRLIQHCTVGTTLAVMTCLVLVIPTELQSKNWDLEKAGVRFRETLILYLWWFRSPLPPRSWGGVWKWWWPALGFAVIFNSCSIPRLSEPAPPFFHSCSFLEWAVSYSLCSSAMSAVESLCCVFSGTAVTSPFCAFHLPVVFLWGDGGVSMIIF